MWDSSTKMDSWVCFTSLLFSVSSTYNYLHFALGPVRTALRRGWRVELYAWEDGLSKSGRFLSLKCTHTYVALQAVLGNANLETAAIGVDVAYSESLEWNNSRADWSRQFNERMMSFTLRAHKPMDGMDSGLGQSLVPPHGK